jgi:predicted amidohydrolase YtcJ
METSSPVSSSIFLVGKIYTGDIKNPWVQAILIENGRIIFAGAASKAEEYCSSLTKIVHVDPTHLVMPGFVDGHVHPVSGGLSLTSLKLSDCKNIVEAQKVTAEYVKNNKDKSWIFATGYADSWFNDYTESSKSKALDEVCPDIPITVLRYDCHAYLCNTKALKLANITKDTENPHAGIVEKSPDGEVTGVLHETAMNLIRKAFPPANSSDFEAALRAGIDLMLKHGITSFVDAAVKEHHYDAYSRVYSSPTQPLPTASLCICWNKMFFDIHPVVCEENMSLLEKFRKISIKNLRVNASKIFVDGVADSKSAYFSQPYIEKNQNKQCDCHYGLPLFTAEELKVIVEQLHKEKIQAHFHAIGDKATTITVDAIENAVTSYGKLGDHRHYIAHLHVVDPTDIKRFRELGISTCFSPVWFQEDSSTKITDELLGEERAKRQYPIKDFDRAGVLNTFGSDWPVSTISPFDGMEVSITRQNLGGSPDNKPWHNATHQLLTLEEAIHCYTIGAAYVAHLDNEVGTLEVGKRANVIITDQNLFNIPVTQIHKTAVLTTMIDGVVAYSLGDWYKQLKN